MMHADVSALIGENYLAYLLLGGLLIVMFSYRDVQLPAGKAFRLIAAVLFVMCISNSIERWAVLSPDRIGVRIAASLMHYIFQPLVLYLELAVLIPQRPGSNGKKVLLALPLIINACIYMASLLEEHKVFWYADDYTFHRDYWGMSVYAVTFFYLVMLVLWSIRTFHRDDKRMSIFLFFVTGIAILTGTLEGLNLIPGYIDESFTLGALIFYTYLITQYEAGMRTDLVEKELELSRSELKLLRRQIKPHFVFNSLHNIKALIRKDPVKASSLLMDFSEYLRANLDSLNSDNLISFEDELENVEAYVSLALVDDSKDIDVVYDIRERHFRLPPLTLEPIVENSISHGLSDKGTVILSTDCDDEDYIVRVTDNGRGFSYDETAACINSGSSRRGIGIENVRTRLCKLCGGTLDIESGSDGTTVTIRIPKSKGALV